jgi:hypothetical protein
VLAGWLAGVCAPCGGDVPVVVAVLQCSNLHTATKSSLQKLCAGHIKSRHENANMLLRAMSCCHALLLLSCPVLSCCVLQPSTASRTASAQSSRLWPHKQSCKQLHCGRSSGSSSSSSCAGADAPRRYTHVLASNSCSCSGRRVLQQGLFAAGLVCCCAEGVTLAFFKAHTVCMCWGCF